MRKCEGCLHLTASISEEAGGVIAHDLVVILAGGWFQDEIGIVCICEERNEGHGFIYYCSKFPVAIISHIMKDIKVITVEEKQKENM